MHQFYISDPRVFELKISDFDFRLYSYLSKNYNLKRLTPYVRIIDCAKLMKVPNSDIKDALQRLSLLNIDYKPLITHKNFTYFDMPRYKYLMECVKFTKNYTNKGYSNVKRNAHTYLNGNYDNWSSN